MHLWKRKSRCRPAALPLSCFWLSLHSTAYGHPTNDTVQMKDNSHIPPPGLQNSSREKRIVKVGIYGIAVNVIYALLKAVIGMLSGSIAVIIDAANNLNDAVSSVIAVGGMKLATRPADKQHPFGHGRVEYICAMAVSSLIVVLGIVSFYNAAKKIVHPTETHYDTYMLVVMFTGVAAKFWLGTYTLRAGRRENSDLLNGSGTENLFDAFVTLGTIVSAAILMIWDIDLDGWFAAVLSVVLIKAGLKILRRTFSDLLGRRIDSGFSQMLKSELKGFPDVSGAFDLIINSYGPDSMVGSVNIEVPERLTAKEIHELTQQIRQRILREYDIHITIGIYAKTADPETTKLREEINALVLAHKGAMEIHGFLCDKSRKQISFDIIADFSVKDRDAFRHSIEKELHGIFPDYGFTIDTDLDYSD